MALLSHLQRRDTGYYFRQSLPKHIATRLGKREIVRSLGTKDAREATERCKRLAFEMSVWLDSSNSEHNIDLTLHNRKSTITMTEELEHNIETLDQSFERWKKLSGNTNPKTIKTYHSRIKEFIAFSNNLPIQHLKKKHLREWRDELLDQGQSHKTVINKIAAIKAVLGVAVDEDIIDSNPAANITKNLSAKTVNKRTVYQGEWIAKLFNSPLYVGCTPSKRHKAGKEVIKDTLFWSFLISFYTGMRPKELLQFTVDDITQQAGVWCFRIHDIGDDHSTKTESSIRISPIHPELIRIGLLEHYNEIKLKEKKSTKLFPYTSNDAFSKRINRYLEHVGLKEKGNISECFYAIRHTLITQARNYNIPEEILYRITGHIDGKKKSIGYSYGDQHKAIILLEYLNKVKYDVDLSHLHTEQGIKDWEDLEALYKDLNVSIDKDTTQASTELSEPKQKPKLSDYTMPLSKAYQTIGKAIYGAAWIPESKMIGTRGEPEPSELSRIDYQWYTENRLYNPDKQHIEPEEHARQIEYIESSLTISNKHHSEQFNTVMKALLNAAYKGMLEYLAYDEMSGVVISDIPDEVWLQSPYPLHYDLYSSTLDIGEERVPLFFNEESLQGLVQQLKQRAT